MDYIEKAILYIGSYFMLFVAATALTLITDLPQIFDVIVFIACIYIVWARDEILAHHIIGYTMYNSNSIMLRILSQIFRIGIGLIIIKMMMLGLFQYVLLLYLIDYFTWVQCDVALSQAITFCKIERIEDES